jgi:hypothetical protein
MSTDVTMTVDEPLRCLRVMSPAGSGPSLPLRIEALGKGSDLLV